MAWPPGAARVAGALSAVVRSARGSRPLRAAGRFVARVRADNLGDVAAGLTYYSVLAMFPALISVIALIGLAGGDGTVAAAVAIVNRLGPANSGDTWRGAIEDLVSRDGRAGVALAGGLAVAVWSASGYVGAFHRASGVIHRRREDRPIWRVRGRQLLVTVLLIVMAAAALGSIVVGGRLADVVGRELGAGAAARDWWQVLRWPIGMLMFAGAVETLYRTASGGARVGRFPISPGAVVALAAWLIAAAAFGAYVRLFADYGETYGALGGVIVFLLWLWLTNLALLIGQEVNAGVASGTARGAPSCDSST